MAAHDRQRIKFLVSQARAPAPPALSQVPPDALVEALLDAGEPWWRRATCAQALHGRLADAQAQALLPRMFDEGETTEVREAMLALLTDPARAHATSLRDGLRRGPAAADSRWRVAALVARAALNDDTAAPALAELAADPWSTRRTPAEQALDARVARSGLEGLLRALDAPTLEDLAFRAAPPSHRLLGVRWLFARGGDVTPALADPTRFVARRACDLLSQGTDHTPALRALSDENLWARVVLQRRGEAVRASAGVALPGVPADVRAAIARRYAPGERDTDPRWILEAAALGPDASEPQSARLARALEALTLARLEPEPPVTAGDFHHQGEGTFHVIATAAGAVYVCTLGPFFETDAADGRATAALRLAGFRHIDGALAATPVDGLHVYCFGHRAPLPVGELLFYWQD